MSKLNIAITGTSSGIGLELTRQALKKNYRVIAFARNLIHSSDLMRLKADHPQDLILAELDVTQTNLDQTLHDAFKEFSCLDILINNAGIFCDDQNWSDFTKSFQVNTIAPYFITQAALAFLKKSKKPLSIYISSLMGSIEDNTSGGYYSYRASKAALNMIAKSFSVDQKWLITSVIHPGWVKTKMGGDNAPTSVSASASGIWNVIDSLSSVQNGCFFDYEGASLPW